MSVLHSACHFSKAMVNVLALRNAESLTDVILVAEDKRFPAHRVILASASEYFRVMFCSGMLETNKVEISLNNISSIGLEAVLDFIYTSSVSVNRDNIQHVLLAANYFQLEHLLNLCVGYLKRQLSLDCCFEIHDLGVSLGLLELQNVANEFILRNLKHLPRDKFVGIPADKLTQLLSDDNLQVESEFALCQKVLSWVRHCESREKLAAHVLKHIRFSLMNAKELSTLMNSPSGTLFVTNSDVRQFIQLAFKYHSRPLLQVAMQSESTNIRGTSETSVVAILRLANPSSPDKLVMLKSGSANASGVGRIVGCSDGTRLSNSSNGSCAGADGSNYASTANELSDTSRDHGWMDVGNLPYSHRAVSDSKIICLYNYLFILGNSEHIRFDPRFETWTELPSMPTRRSGFSVFAANGKIFILGGRSLEKEVIKAIDCFDVVKNEWSVLELDLAFLPTDFAVCNSPDESEVFISGGYVNNRILSSVGKLDLHKGILPICNMTLPRANHSMVLCGDHIYIYGGVDSNRIELLSTSDGEIVNTFDINGMPKGLQEVSMETSAGQTIVHIFGGYQMSNFKQNRIRAIVDVQCPEQSKCVSDRLPENSRILNSSSVILKPIERSVIA